MITQYSAIVSDGIQVIAQSLQETYVSQSLAATSREEVNLYESEMLVLQENDVYTAAVLAGRLLGRRSDVVRPAGQRAPVPGAGGGAAA